MLLANKFKAQFVAARRVIHSLSKSAEQATSKPQTTPLQPKHRRHRQVHAAPQREFFETGPAAEFSGGGGGGDDGAQQTLAVLTNAGETNKCADNELKSAPKAPPSSFAQTAHARCVNFDTSFSDTRVAFCSKKTKILLRDYLVLSMCSSSLLVNNNDALMRMARTLLGARGFELLMRATFYGQFVAGADETELKPVIEQLARYNIKPLIDYGAEQDVFVGNGNDDAQQATTQASSDKNLAIFLRAIDTAQAATNGSGMVAIKLTALTQPALLVKLTAICEFMQTTSRETFSSVAQMLNTFQTNAPHHKLSLSQDDEQELCALMARVNRIAAHASHRQISFMVDAEQSYMQAAISLITLEMMRSHNKTRAIVYNTYQCYLRSTFDTVRRHFNIAREQKFVFSAKLVRGAYIEQERQRAKALNCQDPINESFDATTRVYQTTLDFLLRNIGAQKHKQTLLRCSKQNCATPNDVTSGDSNSSSSSTVAKHVPINIMVASHNEDTIRFALRRMLEEGVAPDDSLVSFGLLYGMSDHVSFSLANAGYSSYKYMPYGPVNEVLPYIGRRARENNGLLEKLDRQRTLIAKELRQRLFAGFNLFHKPTGNYKPA